MDTHRNLALAALVTLGMLAAACESADETTSAPTPAETQEAASPAATTTAATADESGAVALGEPVPAPALEGLWNPDRSTFELASLRGEPTLVFFGYTHCPDVCPATMGELFGVFEQEPSAQAVFVSVDPERDTPEFLEEWTRYLPENLHAITGTPGAIRRAADDWGVKYARVETTSTAGYTMSHTANLYLLDEDGQLLTTYPFGTTSAEIVADLRALAAA